MIRILSASFAFLTVLFLAGCASAVPEPEPAVEQAKAMIREGRAECVLVRDGRIVCIERGRGVSPLLSVYEKHRDAMNGAVVVDKVIGRAAAAIAICGRASHVYGEIMSEDAEDFLRTNGISSSCGLKVHRILNRKRDGLCPLEQSVLDHSDPEKALAALKIRVAELSAGKPKP